MAYKKILASFLIFYCVQTGNTQIKLPALIRDSMVLQRDTKLKIWGWASKGEKVSVKFNGKTVKTTTGADGKWSVWLSPVKAGGPYIMDITGSNKITLKDILVGDVWFCSGQSNMVHQIKLHMEKKDQQEDVANSTNPMIRHFWIPTLTDLQGPREDLPPGYWKSANPQDVLDFSAVGYYFAIKIYDKYKIPIGLINASVGGTPIEAWISEEGLKDFPNLMSTVQRLKDTAYVNNANRSGFGNRRPPRPNDKGLLESKKWFDPSYVPKGWHSINIPGYWEDQGLVNLNGVVWYRREIDVPASMTGIPAKVYLGRIVDADALYINGTQVGNTTYMYPQRRYQLAAGVLKPGKNLFVVRVTNNNGKGGFVPDKPYEILAGGQSLDIKGEWFFKVGEVFAPPAGGRAGGGGGGGGPISAQNQPTALYNAMVAPVINYKVKGFLWYQGEANTGRAAEYAALTAAQVADWRKLWQVENAPYLYVQLPGFMDRQYLPSESQWAMLREAQLKSLCGPNTGMAIAIDLGEWNDIHPDNKKDVGFRLALLGRKIAYGETDIVASGPLYESSRIEGNKIIISFTNTGSGLVAMDGEELSQFAIAGADKKFAWANAKIEGNTVVVWNDEITQPAFVRYAWADNPEDANLFNKEGLPASPFRTDK